MQKTTLLKFVAFTWRKIERYCHSNKTYKKE